VEYSNHLETLQKNVIKLMNGKSQLKDIILSLASVFNVQIEQ